MRIWGVDFADMQSISKPNKGIRYLLCVIDLFSKYAWVVPLKDKKRVSVVSAFQKIFKKSNRKPNKIWVDQGTEFYNNHFKKWLKGNNIEMYSTYNEGRYVAAEIQKVMSEFQNLKMYLLKHMHLIGVKKSLLLKK